MIKNSIKTVNMCFFMTVILALSRGEVRYFVSKVISSEPVLTILSQILLILPAVYYLYKTKTNIAEAFHIRKISLKQIFLIFVFTLVLMPVLTFINALSMVFAQNHIQSTISSITEQYPFWVNICTMAIVPALLEETVYRGLFYREYQKVNIGKGILLSAFLFGCMHMNFNQFAYAFFMGIIFCILIEVTDSIFSSVLMHFIINGSSLVLAEFTMKEEQILETQELSVSGEDMFQTIPYLILPALIGAVLAFIIFKIICRVSGRDVHIRLPWNEKSNGNILTASLLAGILICVVIMVGNR